MFFGISEEILNEKKAYNTAKEILQQPILWRETVEIFKNSKEKLDEFFKKIGLNEEFEIIFTGAGTSEYVGNILAPLLRKNNNLEYKSIGTTDILNNPLNYINKNKKILLVSFARSGDSPESVGVVNILNEQVKDSYHLFITCNKNGALAKIAENNEKTFVLFMPEESNDKGFAMTSSFSCMLLAGILSFVEDKEKEYGIVNKVIDISEKLLESNY